MLIRKVIPGSASSLLLVNHNESYGRHILKKNIRSLKIQNCIDLGCGKGDDLEIILQQNPKAHVIGIDFYSPNLKQEEYHNFRHLQLNIETERLPFENDSIDFVIANQILEHTKEIFWINHEVFRCLKEGGHLFIGVPNLLSFHNRILMTLGFHPTQHKLISAHVRPFSKKDIRSFYKQIGSSFCKVKGFWGSQFYPFPKIISRCLSSLLPSLSFSIFFLNQKTGPYNSEFVYPNGQKRI